MAYLLDTDYAIQALAGRQPAVGTLTRMAGSPIALSIITLAELYERAFTSPNPQAHLASFRDFWHLYHLLPLTEPIVERFAELRSGLRRRGDLIPDFDLLIAATALEHDLTLLTFNQRHFRRIPDLRISQQS